MARNKSAREKRQDRQRRARESQADPEYGAPGVTVHAVRNMDEAMVALFGPGPASDDWRQDVLGGKRLSVRLGRDGLTINGHLLTREMCEALQAERPDDAADFEYEKFQKMGRQMVPGMEMRRPAPL